MIGIDLLKEKLIEMGFNSKQAQSKTVYAVLSICANCPEVLNLYELNQEIEKLHMIIENNRSYILRQERQCNVINREIQNRREELKEERELFLRERSDFENKLVNAETDEAKASLRKAQFFMNNVKVETKYDNTAYIAGLAAILSDGKIDSLKELHKMNPSISDIKSTY